MVRERKCILCHIVYSSKKEMDEHMRSMLHHRELENLKGRDSNHECRVCRVTVVGLSAYAKHISSQLHKDNTDAYDREEEGKEEADEEYFDQELVQLINQRKEQSGQDETCNTNEQPETDDRRLQRKREDRGPHQDRDQCDQAGWHHRGTQQRDWKWENASFVNPRQGNFPHSARNPNSSKYPIGPRGRAGWHLITSGGSTKRSSGGAWHSNGGSSLNWHHGSTSRNHNWHPESCFSFPSWQPSNCGGNWKSSPHGANGWNDAFPPVRNRVDDMALGWNKKRGRSIKYNRVRYTWERQENEPNETLTPYGDPAEEQCDPATYAMDFTSDKLPPEGAFDFSIPEKSDHKNAKCTGKGASPSRDKPHRWSPYPSQKVAENQPGTADDVAENTGKDPSFLPFQSPSTTLKDPKTSNAGIVPKLTMKEDLVYPSKNKLDAKSSVLCKESADTANGRSDQDKSKSNRMPSLKSPLLATPDKKLSIQKRGPTNMQKSNKLSFPSSPREGRTRLSALNLEIDQSNSYVSKLRSASSRNLKANKGTVDTSPKEPVESLSEVLRKAKEILQCSQSMRSQHFLESCKNQSEEVSSAGEVSKTSEKRTELQMDFLENVSDGELSDYENSETQDGIPDPVHTSSSCVIAPSDNTNKKDCNSVETSGTLSSSSDIATVPPKYPTVPIKSIESTSSLVQNLETASVESEGSEDPLKYDAHVDSEGMQNSISDQEMQKGGSQQSLLPDLSKLGLPVSLQRDLTRHIGSKTKAGSHLPEPNLNSARRIRNVSGHRKTETDKESGLKPTLRQILNASRRNVNWEQVIHHVTKKKQELGKGLPRFGIEMVAPVQNENDGFDFEEEPDLSSFEGLHWEAISMALPGGARKRSLSESSVVLDRTACVYSFFADQATDRRMEQRQSIPASQSGWSAANASKEMLTVHKKEDTAGQSSPGLETSASLTSGRRHSAQSPVTTSTIKREEALQSLDSQNTLESPEEGQSLSSAGASIFPTSNVVDAATDSSCTSGTEQNDSQSVGKKRRATADGSSPEIPSLERKNKRRKIKGKKERSQVDHLLNISLREEELSKSLQNLDTNLLQARSTLQAAYVEVQRLMVLKQQITMEMSAMRTQRIQILQGLQETLEPSEQADQTLGNVSGERRNSRLHAAPSADLSPSNLFALFLDTPSFMSPHTSPSGPVLGAPLRVSTPPAFQTTGRVANSAPDSSVPVKQEPASSHGEKADLNTLLNGSLLALQGGSLQIPGEISQSTAVYPIVTPTLSEMTKGFPLVQEETAADKSKHKTAEMQLPSQSKSSCNSKGEGSDLMREGALSERRGSVFQSQTLPENTPVENESTHPLEQLEQKESTLASVESRGSKKKKKLRKKKTLRAAHVPENSDTEQDICGKPVRKVKCKRIPKEGSVTTSTSFEQEDGGTTQATERNKDENDTDSPVEHVEVSNFHSEVVEIDSESGDVKPDSPSKRDPLDGTEKRLLEVARLGYDEVSSTSEMGANYRDGVLRSVVETQTPVSSVRGSKNSSEVSSEPGEDEDPTEGIFEGHQAAVNAIQIFGGLLYTCSADKTVRAYSLVSRKCVAIFEGHTSKVNCLLLTLTSGKNSVLYTGSSDHTIRCYNIKSRECINQFQLDDRVVCLHTRWRILFGGLANGNVVTFGIKSGKQLDTFECHGPRAVSCLASAQEGARRLLLVGSYDCTISVRDARNGLLLRTLEGHSKTVLCMKVVNDLVFSGSSDQSIHAHNIHTGELVRIYKGHNHAVTVVNILGKVMVTASLDKFVRVYELQSHDRLQVYGGHTDMIMCMTIHKSMIYTGCYDGSIQAVRLNLMQNYRCWWHGCSLIFGVVDHLKQHLLSDHTNPNFQTLKCRWKNCDAFFTARRGSKQDAPGHIERHAEEDSKMDT